MSRFVSNLFTGISMPESGEELFETLAGATDLKIERIVSQGQVTPKDFWYDQHQDEWVVLLTGNAVIEFADGDTHALNPGDYLVIKAHEKHRVTFTTVSPACIWLAVHGNFA